MMTPSTIAKTQRARVTRIHLFFAKHPSRFSRPRQVPTIQLPRAITVTPKTTWVSVRIPSASSAMPPGRAIPSARERAITAKIVAIWITMANRHRDAVLTETSPVLLCDGERE